MHGKIDCHAMIMQCVESSDYYAWNHCHAWLILANALLKFCLSNTIMNHDSGFIIGIAHVFFVKTLIEHTPKNHLGKHPPT